MKKIALSFFAFALVAYGAFLAIDGAFAFTGPSCAAGGSCSALISDGEHLGAGTSTLPTDTLLYLIATSTDSSFYAVRALDRNKGPLLLVRNDGRVSIGTASFSTTSTLWVAGTVRLTNSGNIIFSDGTTQSSAGLNAPVDPGVITPGFFNGNYSSSSGLYQFPAAVMIGTTTVPSNTRFFVANATSGVLYVSTAGRVGIGVAAPTVSLDVSGGAQFSGNISASGTITGNLGAPYITTGVFGSGNFAFPGNLGVNTSTAPAGSLGNFFINGSSYQTGSSTVLGTMGVATSNNTTYGLSVGGGGINANLFYQNGAPFSASQWTSTSTGIYYQGGKVAIGTSTPSGQLTVVTADDGTPWTISGWTNKHNALSGTGSDGLAASYSGTFGSYLSSWGPSGWKDLYFQADDTHFYGNGSLALKITNAGSIAIGTNTAATAKMEIWNTASDNMLKFWRGVTTSSVLRQGSDGTVVLQVQSTDGLAVATSGSVSVGTSTSPTNGRFNVGYSGSNLLSVLTTGNVGIGTSSPQEALVFDRTTQNAIQWSEGGAVRAWLGVAGSATQLLPETADNDTALRAEGNLLIGAGGYNTRMYISSAGRVGIGTAQASTTFHVVGSSTITGPVGIASTTSATYQLSVGGGINATGFFQNGVALGTGYFARDNTNGVVYLATTTDKYSIGSTTAATGKLEIWNTASDNMIKMWRGNTTSSIIRQGTDATIVLQNQSVDAIAITAAGNMGIGNTAPDSKLTVGADPVGGSGNFTSVVAAGGTSAIFSDNTNSELYIKHPSTGIIRIDSDAGNVIRFADGGVDNLTILGSGSVGIGTSSPAQLLHLYQNAADNKVVIQGTGTQYDQHIEFKDDGGSWYVGQRWQTSANNFGIGTTANKDQFVIDSSGNIGIGTSSPPTKFALNGGTALFDNPSASIRINATSSVLSNNDLGIWRRIASGGPVYSFADWNTGNNGLFINTSNGNVGIGTGASLPVGKLDVVSAFYTATGTIAIRAQDSSAEGGELSLAGAQAQYPTWSFDNYAGAIRWYSGGTVYMSLATSSYTGTLTIGSAGAGKINAGTVDPPYTIGGVKYATYMPSMVGQKEEVVGTVSLSGKDNEYIIDFGNQPKGSDLWLFAQVTNLKKHFGSLTAQLTAGFDGRVWYVKDEKNMHLIIKGTGGGEVSYRFTAPRFDAEKWPNTRNDEIEGFVLP